MGGRPRGFRVRSSKIVREKYIQIPWKDIAGMRDRLFHAYSEVDLKLVWMTIKQRLPELKTIIEEIINLNQK